MVVYHHQAFIIVEFYKEIFTQTTAGCNINIVDVKRE